MGIKVSVLNSIGVLYLASYVDWAGQQWTNSSSRKFLTAQLRRQIRWRWTGDRQTARFVGRGWITAISRD